MTKKDFSIWLIQHELTQKQLADLMGISAQTITNYKNSSFPAIFLLALKQVENQLNTNK